MPESPHLLPREIAKLCYNAKWIDADRLFIAVAVCIAESNGYTEATHVNADGSTDRGLWQINNKAHPEMTDADCFDPVKATAYARKVYEGRSNTFTAWAAFNNGAYLGPRAAPYAAQGIANFLLTRHGLPIV